MRGAVRSGAAPVSRPRIEPGVRAGERERRPCFCGVWSEIGSPRDWLLVAVLLVAAVLPAAPRRAWAAAGEAIQLRRFALIVGSNRGSNSSSNTGSDRGSGRDLLDDTGGSFDPDPAARLALRYATSDAQAFSRVLEELGGIARADRLLLLDPGREALEAGFAHLTERIRAASGSGVRTEALVYYSGHSDEGGLLLGDERVPYPDLRARLDALPADVRIAILDSCASGALTRRKGGQRRPPFMIDVSAAVRGYAFLTSTSATEAAQESDRLQASFFTHFLISGLRGAADVSDDGKVTLTEAYQFAFEETLARTESTHAGPQHANYDIQLAGSGDLVMTDLRGTSSLLVLPAKVAGRVYVRGDDGRLVAELNKIEGRAVELGLDPGTYSVQLLRDGELRRGLVELGQRERRTLGDLDDFDVVEREVVAVRGGSEVESHLSAPEPDRRPQEAGPSSAPESSGGKDFEPARSAKGGGRTFALVLVPGVGFPVTAPGGETRFALNVVYGRSRRVDGMVLGMINRVDEEMRGFQLGAANISAGPLYGTQLALGGNLVFGGGRGLQLATGFNVAEGDFEGMQLASGFNLASPDDTWLGQLAAGFNVGRHDQRGLQAAAGFNVVSGDTDGLFQAAAGFNVVGGEAGSIFQASGGFNVVGDSALGFQGAGGFNVVGGSARGFQGAGVVNVAGDEFTGVQSSGVLNVGGGIVRGAQLAGVLSYGRDVRGAQLSVLNIAADVTGLQLGVLNIATGRVDGTQIGLFNIAGEYDRGGPVGLFSFVRDGQLHADLWSSNLFASNLSLRFGSRNVYTVLSAGHMPAIGESKARAGIGLGLGGMGYLTDSLYLGGDVTWWEIDASVKHIDKLRLFHGDADEVAQLRVILGWELAEHFALFGGAGVNAYFNFRGDPVANVGNVATREVRRGSFSATLWPGFFAGVAL